MKSFYEDLYSPYAGCIWENLENLFSWNKKTQSKIYKKSSKQTVKAGNKSLIQMTLLDEILYIINHCSFKQFCFLKTFYTQIYSKNFSYYVCLI